MSISVFVCLDSTPPAPSRPWDSVFLTIWVSPGGACLSDLDGCYRSYGINCSCWRGTEVILQKMTNRAGLRMTGEDAASRPSVPLAGDLGLFIWATWPDGLPSDGKLLWSQGKRSISYSVSGFTAGALLGSTTQVLIVQQVCVLVAQSCPTLCDPRDWSPAGSSVHGILQARILEWVAFPSPCPHWPCSDYRFLSKQSAICFKNGGDLLNNNKHVNTWIFHFFKMPRKIVLQSYYNHSQCLQFEETVLPSIFSKDSFS